MTVELNGVNFADLFKRHCPDGKVRVCNGQEHKEGINVSAKKAQDRLKDYLKIVQTAAANGKTACDLKITLDQRGETVVALRVLQALGVDNLQLTSIDDSLYAPHSLFCSKKEIDLYPKWQLNNPHVNAKPVLSLQVILSPAEQLNVLRRDGLNTDGTLIFGQESFPIHWTFFTIFFKPPFNSQWQETQKKEMRFPEVNFLTREELDEVISFMYLNKIKFTSNRHAINVLKLSEFLLNNNLRAIAFKYIWDNIQDFNPSDKLSLFLQEAAAPFPDLTELCKWVMSYSPDFYLELLKVDVSSEDLFGLFALASKHERKDMLEGLQKFFNEVDVEAKIAFLLEAIKTENLDLQKQMKKLCKVTLPLIPADHPKRGECIKAYKELTSAIIDQEAMPKK